MNKQRAIILDFSALTDKNGNLNYFLLTLIDNITMYDAEKDDFNSISGSIPQSAYCDLLIYAQDEEEFKAFAEKWCIGYKDIYSGKLDNILKYYKKHYKTIGMIMSSSQDVSFVNKKFVQVLEIDKDFKHGAIK